MYDDKSKFHTSVRRKIKETIADAITLSSAIMPMKVL